MSTIIYKTNVCSSLCRKQSIPVLRSGIGLDISAQSIRQQITTICMYMYTPHSCVYIAQWCIVLPYSCAVHVCILV